MELKTNNIQSFCFQCDPRHIERKFVCFYVVRRFSLSKQLNCDKAIQQRFIFQLTGGCSKDLSIIGLEKRAEFN